MREAHRQRTSSRSTCCIPSNAETHVPHLGTRFSVHSSLSLPLSLSLTLALPPSLYLSSATHAEDRIAQALVAAPSDIPACSGRSSPAQPSRSYTLLRTSARFPPLSLASASRRYTRASLLYSALSTPNCRVNLAPLPAPPPSPLLHQHPPCFTLLLIYLLNSFITTLAVVVDH